ncbi:MAG: RNA polymerase sigma-70 factor [Bacteroidales bacterium]|nr:RNA polymerase sigma-70 factor [Bacteroidales bacterium]
MVIPHSEPELIALLKQGSQEAFKSLYDLYARRLYAFCMEYTKSREDTEEIVQDAFVWLWRNRASIRQESTIKNLLFLRVKHFLINAWRARVNTPIFEDYVDYINSLPADSRDHLEYMDFRDTVMSIIDQLPKTQSKVVKMSRLEGFKNKEIAEKLRLSEQTVKNALSMGLKFLKERLGTIEMLVLCVLFSVFK